MTLPTIRLQDIPHEGLTLDVTLSEGWLRSSLAETGLAPEGGAGGRASVRLDRDGVNVTLSGRVEAALVAECVACLGAVSLPVATDFQLFLEPRPSGEAAKAGAHHEVELSAGELDVDYYDAESIELGTWLREQILLEAPVHPRHEGECPTPLVTPSAPQSGEAPREIDPRLAPLRKFTKKE